MTDRAVLEEFLRISPVDTDEVFERFDLPGAVLRGEGKKRFLYIRGMRKHRVLLVAHADTVWDGHQGKCSGEGRRILIADGIIRSGHSKLGLGGDDRAGCAMLWLLRESGHSLLITDGEETGRQGSGWLMNAPCNGDLADEINHSHRFVVQLDRRHGSEYKCYDVGTGGFRSYIEAVTGFKEPDRGSYTDIVCLCRDIAGVNLSVGYYEPHSLEEYVRADEWQRNLDLYRRWLYRENLPRFTRQ